MNQSPAIDQPSDQIQVLLQETEALLERWKHPDPYKPPTAPGGTMSLDNDLYDRELIGMAGSKYERNMPPPNLDRTCLHAILSLCLTVVQLLHI